MRQLMLLILSVAMLLGSLATAGPSRGDSAAPVPAALASSRQVPGLAAGVNAGGAGSDDLNAPRKLVKPATLPDTPETNVSSSLQALREQSRSVIVAATLVSVFLIALGVGLLFMNRSLRRLKILVSYSEARFKVMVERAPEAIVVYDIDLERIVDANVKAEQLFGCTREELLQGGPQRFYAPRQPDLLDVAESVNRHNQRAAAGEEVIFERAVRRADGRELTCEVRLVTLPYREQRLVRASYIDVTERKLSEQVLRDSEKHLKTIFDRSPIAIALVDMQGRLTYSNLMLSAMIGYRSDELLQMSFTDFTYPEDADIDLQQFHELVEGRIPWYSMEKRYVHKGGAIVWANLSVTVIRDDLGQPQEIIGMANDITERKQAERELEESRKQYRGLVEGTPDLVTRVDAQGRLLFVNHAAQEIFGLAPPECLGRPAFDFIHPEDRETTRTAFLDWLNSEVAIFTHENRQVSIDGRVHHMAWSIRAEYGENGEMAGFASTARDMTYRKLAEEARILLEGQLLQAQKMESVGRLAGGVAHDFNNMLLVILGHAQIALEQLGPAHPLNANLMEIRRAAEHSADLTRQLLAFARKQTIAPKVLELNRLVAGMLLMLQRLIGEGIQLTWQPGADLWPVRVDSSQVNQILANLCVNARDAIAGVGKIAIMTANIRADALYCQGRPGFAPGDYVLISVSDNGIGMDQETREHLFEPFYTTKELGKGTGLGLSTVYGAVKQNHGFIDVSSEPGQGSIFSIYLPRHSDAAGQARGEAGNEPIPQGEETVLLVEDEAAVLKLTTGMLETLGYTVLAAATPGEAASLARAYSGAIHLLVTDVVMPEMNGLDLAKHLISHDPDLKCLLMSGYAADTILDQGVLDEGVHFIQKPFSLGKLALEVRKALDGL
jgi:two-component system, cell cycle sensor histidine kinase and response regulator CckA